MEIRPDALLAELQRLRKGRGAYHPSVSKRFGEDLRTVCGVPDPAASPSELRAGLEKSIGDLLSGEPKAMAAMRAAVGLEPAGSSDAFKTLEKRLEWAGSFKLFVEARAARDRVDEALHLFVQSAVANASRLSGAGADPGYVVDDFRVHLPFIGRRPKFVEERKIRSARDQLDVARLRRGVPTASDGSMCEHPFKINVLDGGLLRGVDVQRGVIAYDVEFSQKLVWGQVHKLVVELIPSDEQRVSPHYVVQPITPFQSFTVSAHFDPRMRPIRVRRVCRTPHGEIDIFPPGEEPLALDAHGRVETTFRKISDGLSYGIAWEWPPAVGEGMYPPPTRPDCVTPLATPATTRAAR